MNIATLTSKGQLTLPLEIRRALGLQKSDRVQISVENGEAILKPLKGTILDHAGSVKLPQNKPPLNVDQALEFGRKSMAQDMAKGN